MKDLLEQLKTLTQKKLGLELELKALQEEEKQVNQTLLNQMLENGQHEAKTLDGTKFKITSCYTGGISKENAPAASRFLYSHGINLDFKLEFSGRPDALLHLQ